MALLQVRDLTRSFYGIQALVGADLDVHEGTITGLIGPNGAGKTTLFNCVSGVIPPDAGTVSFDGRDITGVPPEGVTRAGMVRTFQIARGFPRLSVLENLMLYGAMQPGEHLVTALAGTASSRRHEAQLRDRAIAIAGNLNLSAVIDNPASDLSGGQKKLLELGRALMAEPRMILLDEPIAGVNPTLSREIADHLIGLRNDGMTLLIIEHDMDMIARLCDPVTVMAEGRRLTEGSFSAVANDARVQEAYLGARQ